MKNVTLSIKLKNTLKTLKMIKENIHPKNFQTLNELNVCSNKIIGGGNIIGIDNFAPLLIGDGIIPAVWLYARIDKVNWTAIVKESESFHSQIQIIANKINREVIIKIENTIILSAKMTSDKICTVDSIDLRPIGFNVYGNANNFQIANSSFNGNTFQGVSFMIGFGDKKE